MADTYDERRSGTSTNVVPQLGVGQVVIFGGAVLSFIATFLPWFELSAIGQSETVNAYNDEIGTQWFAVIVIVGMAGAAAIEALRSFTGVVDGRRPAGFAPLQAVALLAVAVALVLAALAFTVVRFPSLDESLGDVGAAFTVGVGLWLSLLGAVLVVAGSAYEQRRG